MSFWQQGICGIYFFAALNQRPVRPVIVGATVQLQIPANTSLLVRAIQLGSIWILHSLAHPVPSFGSSERKSYQNMPLVSDPCSWQQSCCFGSQRYSTHLGEFGFGSQTGIHTWPVRYLYCTRCFKLSCLVHPELFLAHYNQWWMHVLQNQEMLKRLYVWIFCPLFGIVLQTSLYSFSNP